MTMCMPHFMIRALPDLSPRYHSHSDLPSHHIALALAKELGEEPVNIICWKLNTTSSKGYAHSVDPMNCATWAASLNNIVGVLAYLIIFTVLHLQPHMRSAR